MTSTDEFSIREITVSRQSPGEERQAALHQIYAQVLERQPYGFERKQLAKIEAEFLKNKIGVKRFLRELGHSEVYLTLLVAPPVTKQKCAATATFLCVRG